MASPSSQRSFDDRLEIPVSDDSDDDENAAPTKVGPMSKAFVDQLMFKAQVAETATPSSSRPNTVPPVSGLRPTVARTEEVVAPPAALADAKLPALWDETEEVDGTARLDSVAPDSLAPSLAPSPAPSLAPSVAPSMGAPLPMSLFVEPTRAPRDWRLTIEVASVLGSLGVAAAAAIIWLFP